MTLKTVLRFIGITLISTIVLSGCNRVIYDITVTSSAFGNDDVIPDTYTCAGSDISPPLSISVDSSATDIQSLVVIVDDPDAPVGTFVHWVLFNLPADLTGLSEAFGGPLSAEMNYNIGTNSFGDQEYGGPCPPGNSEHRYYFRVYALDTTLNLPDGASRQQVDLAMIGHIKAQGELMGRFSL